jgi:single-stranded-DNA-specific exonuclease
VKLQVEKWDHIYDAVFFSTTAAELGVREGERVDLVFTPQLNTFRGKTSVQFLLSDLANSERRLTGRAKKLCRALAKGLSPTAEEARLLCPEREDFVRLWLKLRQRGKALRGQADQVLTALARDLGRTRPAKVYLCLKVLDELGLARVEEEADTMHISLAEQAEKVELSTSRMLSALADAKETDNE